LSLYQATQAPPAPSLGAELRAAGVYACGGVLALLLQTTVLHTLSGGRAIPDLVLILCVYLGLYQHSVGGAAGAFVLGYLLDSFSGSVVGLNALAMTSVYVVVYLMSRRLWMDNVLSAIAMVFLATFLKGAVILGALSTYLGIDRISLQAAETLFAEALLAAALAPAVFAALGWGRRAAGVG
jgi:rod shape-determining protein MreD